MIREQILLTLQQEYSKRQEDNLRTFEQTSQRLFDRCEGLEELVTARHAMLLQGVRSGILNRQGATETMPHTMADYNQKIIDTLLKNGFDADSLQPTYHCPVCKDEGYLYQPTRTMCDCMANELKRRILTHMHLDDRQTFETFNEMLFDPEKKGDLPSQRQITKANMQICLRYADGFPNTEHRDLLLYGGSGLGKTFLLRAIAYRMVERGMIPLYTSAYHFFEVARKAYIQNDSDVLTSMLKTPLLLLDDLGTEPLMNNITVTQLFNLLNERQQAQLHTVISTNLTFTELRDRYTERVTSRLLDATTCKRMVFMGNDIRKNLRKEL